MLPVTATAWSPRSDQAQLRADRGETGLELRGTTDQQLIYLNTHWGGQYAFAPPPKPWDEWTATAKFGRCDQLHAQTAAELLGEVRAHYQANKPEDQHDDGP
jgi:hypothetical protein